MWCSGSQRGQDQGPLSSKCLVKACISWYNLYSKSVDIGLGYAKIKIINLIFIKWLAINNVALSSMQGKLTDGTVFDSSFERGDPIEFELGSGQVIPGVITITLHLFFIIVTFYFT